MDISTLPDDKKILLINQRFESSAPVWDEIIKNTKRNINIYKNRPEYIESGVAIKKKAKIRANRIFRNMESVINALIANPPKPNFIPTRDTPQAKDMAEKFQQFFSKKYDDLNVKEQIRKGLRNLYFSRLIILKPYWDTVINDFNIRAIDPTKVRISPSATKEEEAAFIIEEVSDNLMSVVARFPEKKDELLKLNGFNDETDAFLANPTITYRETWIQEYVLFSFGSLFLGEIKNPYWDFDGLKATDDEQMQLGQIEAEQRRNLMSYLRETQPERDDMAAYYFNHFNFPRKPYIFATIFNNDNKIIGQTDMIDQAAPLQEGVDRRKQDIDENASLVNGQVKVDSSVMSKADAQKLRFEARGVIWGKGVKDGVSREVGTALPQFVYEDMVDSRSEIDNIMAASSAFRGEREGQETKAGRLALIDQSYLALNEMVQVVDYVSYEMFNWFVQLAKVKYTEMHTAKILGPDNGLTIVNLMQDDFEDGIEIKVIGGKTLPEDRQFKYEQAQVDAEKGFISPVDYLEIAGYDDPMEKAKNAQAFALNPPIAAGLSPEEVIALTPIAPPEEVPPTTSP